MSVKELSNQIDLRLSDLSERYGMMLLESSIGLVYVWFGALKFPSGLSPAEGLAADTMDILTFHLLDKQGLLWGLASIEVLMGLLLLCRIQSKWVVLALLLHMLGTLSPVVLFPEVVFDRPPFGFSIVGQYITKNVIIIAAALVIYAKKVNR
ncbi:doxx family protein [Reichenbachiella sp. MSK19-1]|uniref:doxx family protein n=1 Tax=Reichenbachiella sp. MSK19-1 TaxID=1897631 RepID=UPI000E6B4FE9|nr:doxx family protein [Reichenbachiella sp. MSK19-1]RJE74623.1 doxx family protein [Reichenbachiella sp. MSK19-1]